MALADQIPGLREAMQRERDLRELAFVGHAEPIAGVAVVPLNLQRLNLLMVARNAYVTGGAPSPAHAAQFLWVVFVGFAPGDLAARDAFVRRVARLPWDDVDAGIRSYLDAALFDLTADSGGATSGSAPVISWLAAMVDQIAREYHWSRDEILTMPIAEMAQYLRRIEQRAGARPRNPYSDAATAAWLREVNSRATN